MDSTLLSTGSLPVSNAAAAPAPPPPTPSPSPPTAARDSFSHHLGGDLGSMQEGRRCRCGHRRRGGHRGALVATFCRGHSGRDSPSGGALQPRQPAARGGLTLSLLAMNLCFYEAISRAPVGVVVAVEFLGPLGIAVAGSRQVDVVWWCWREWVFVLADPSGSVSTAGLLSPLAPAACWAAFLLLQSGGYAHGAVAGNHADADWSGVLLTPILGDRSEGCRPRLRYPTGFGCGCSSWRCRTSEMVALKRVRASTYGVLLSLEPIIAALMDS